MSKGRWVASSELEGPGVQPQGWEQGRGVGYAYPERGPDRKSLRKGSFSPAEFMGTSQQLNISPHKGETLDLISGRDFISGRPVNIRPSSNNGNGGPPVMAAHNSTRALVRPQPAPFGNVLSPRTYHSTSYRDVALVAAQHGLSAYAHSAAATAAAAAIRGHTPRSGGGTLIFGGGSNATPGRPPPAPRPTQHSAPTQVGSNSLPNGAATELLPSCSGASPVHGTMAPTRGGPNLPPSRGSAPAPSSPDRDSSVYGPSAGIAGNRPGGDVAMITVTSNDVWWRSAFEGSVEPDDPLAGGSTSGSGVAGAGGATRVMSPGWGAAPPSVYEADGRPGTRGGGPQFDIDGRPTTRSGQRPLSRAQLSLSQHRPPAHVAPLGGQGWAGLFAAGSGTGSGEVMQATAVSPPQPPPCASSPRAPSAGTSISWSGEASEAPGSYRRQLVPLTPLITAATGASRLSSPSARVVGNGTSGGVGPGATLSPLVPPGQLSGPPSANQSPQGFQPPILSPTNQLAAASGGGSNGSSSSTYSLAGGCTIVGSGAGSTRAQISSKLSSIAEAPGSPVLLPLPPHSHSQPHQQPYKVPTVRADGGGFGGRKAPREREAGFMAVTADGDAQQFPSPNMILEEVHTDDSRLSNMDQDAGSRGAAGVGGRGRGGGGGANMGNGGGSGGGGRTRVRRNSNISTGGSGPFSYFRGHSSSAAVFNGLLQSPSRQASQTDETPSIRPRR